MPDAPEPTPVPDGAAAAAAAEAAKPVPPPPPAPEPEIEELPEGQDTFDREYVEKVRGEAAKYRTRARDVDVAFTGYSPEMREQFLKYASNLHTDPRQAMEDFRGVADRLAQQLGEEADPVTDPAPTNDPAPKGEEPGTAALTPDDVQRLVQEQLTAAQQESDRDAEIRATLAEAEALDDAYKDPAAKAHLFAVAQANNTDLAGAHEIIASQLQETIDAAVADHLAKVRTGEHAPRLPSGDPASGSKPVDWAKEAQDGNALKLARQRADERMRAAGFGGD